jgi:hypothetical protein
MYSVKGIYYCTSQYKNIFGDSGICIKHRCIASHKYLFLDNIDIFLFYLVTEKKAITGY